MLINTKEVIKNSPMSSLSCRALFPNETAFKNRTPSNHEGDIVTILKLEHSFISFNVFISCYCLCPVRIERSLCVTSFDMVFKFRKAIKTDIGAGHRCFPEYWVLFLINHYFYEDRLLLMFISWANLWQLIGTAQRELLGTNE